MGVIESPRLHPPAEQRLIIIITITQNHPYTTTQKLGPGATADEFSSSFAALVTDQSNLVLRALDLFRRKTGKADFFKVYLEKRTPVQAGLGGGSSNAATTLFAANQVGAGLGRWTGWSFVAGSRTRTQLHTYIDTVPAARCWAAPRATRT